MRNRSETDLMVIAALAVLLTPWLLRREVPGDATGSTPTPQRSVSRPGLQANTPSAIPPQGWWQILKRVGAGFSNDRIMAEAAGVTFYALLAIFPALAALVSLYGLISDPHTVAKQLSNLAGVIPGGGLDILNDELKSLTSSDQKALGVGAIVGFATTLWSANAGIKAMFDALNSVYEEKESRGFVKLTLLSLTFTMGSLIFVILAMTAVVVIPAVLAFVGFGGLTDTLVSWARWPLLLVGVALFLAFLYRWGPSRIHAKWRWLTWGSAFAAFAWVIASGGFSWYVGHFGSYNKTYGSLGAVVGFMTWIWISTIIVLTGAELNAQMEKQTGRDTTVGPARPRGTRGAAMADTLAQA